jgi:hypothetical protein
MPIEKRVIVHRDRQGNVIRIVTVETPIAPSTSSNPAAVAPLARVRQPLVEEVHPDQAQTARAELERTAQTKK